MASDDKKIIRRPVSAPPPATREELHAERDRLKHELARATNARSRLDLMISTTHAEAIVPTLPTEEVYFTVKEVGLNDAIELVHLASPAQFRSFVDLDAWKDNSLEVPTALIWLRAAATDDDDERLRKKLAGLDIELIELLLKSTLNIWDLEEDPDPEPVGQTYESPEGRYLVEFQVEGAEYVGARRLLDLLYAEDPFKAARMLEAVRWELPSELEESSYRWRNARMADLGFPELSEALSYYAYTDPDAPLPQLEQAPPVAAGLFLERLQPADRFFDRALKLVPAEQLEVVERQMVTLLNAVMVAEKVDPGELEQVQRAIEGARDTLSLGLEHASAGDPARAATLLVGAPLKRVFQIGFSLALKLKHRADRLMKSGRASLAGSKDVPIFDSPIGETIAALRRRRPLYSEALDAPEAPSPATRPFRDRAELARASAALDDSERLSDLAASLGFDSAAASQALSAGQAAESLAFLRLSDLYLTAVARGLVGEGFAFAPLPASRLGDFARGAFEIREGAPVLAHGLIAALHEPMERAAAALSEAHRKSAEAFLKLCEKRLLEDAGRPFAASGALDPQMPLPLVVAG